MNFLTPSISAIFTVEPRYDEGPRDCQNVFVITRFGYIEGFSPFFVYFTITGVKKIVCYIEDIVIKVPPSLRCRPIIMSRQKRTMRLDVPTLLDIRFNKFIFKE